MTISIIAAYAVDNAGRRVIGINNKLPWNHPHDLRRFKEYTSGNAIVMGRKTFESIGRVLPRRDNIVLTRQVGYSVPGGYVFSDLDDALDFAATRNYEVFIAGGQEVYEQTLNKADRLYLTRFDKAGIVGDAFFPWVDCSKFKCIHKEEHHRETFEILQRYYAPKQGNVDPDEMSIIDEVNGHQLPPDYAL